MQGNIKDSAMVQLTSGEEADIGSININSLALMAAQSKTTIRHDNSSSEFAQFKFFSQLPAEVRLQIWSVVPQPPIIIDFEYRPESPTFFAGRLQNLLFPVNIPNKELHVSGPIPPLLHACSESREVMKKYYTPAFATLLGHPIWFHYETSILALHNIVRWWFEGSSHSDIATALGPVQRIIVDDLELTNTITYTPKRLQVLENPSVLYLVVRDGLMPEFRVMWLAMMKQQWIIQSIKNRSEDRRLNTGRLEIRFATYTAVDGTEHPLPELTCSPFFGGSRN